MRKLSKRMLAVFIAMLMIFSLAVTAITPVGAITNYPDGLAIFFKPNSQWRSGDVKFAAFFSGSGGYASWYDLEDYDGDGFYKTEIPSSSITYVSFGCFAADDTNYHESKYIYRSNSFTYDGVNNCYTLTEGYTDGRGTWSTNEDDWIYFINTYGWANVYACFYDDNLSGAGWPGTKCTLIDKNYQCYGIQAQNCEFVTFSANNGQGNFSKRYRCEDVIGKGISDNNTPGVFDSWRATYNYAKKYDSNFGSFLPKDTPTVSLAGTFNDWSLTKNVFTRAFGGDYRYSLYLPSGMYEFKIVHNSLWYGSNYTVGLWIDPIELSAKKDNINLISEGGTFNFYYNVTDHKLTVDYTDDVLRNECDKKIALSGSFNDWGIDTMMAPMPEQLEYFQPCDASYTSLNSALASIGVDNSKEYRMQIAKVNGMTDYEYTAEQNTELLELLKKGDLINPECLTTGDDENVVYTNVTLKRGTHYFSIVEDGLWYGDTELFFWDASTNYRSRVIKNNGGACVLKTSGYAESYCIKYNYETKEVSVSPKYNNDKIASANISLVGSFNDWKAGAKFRHIPENNYYTQTVTLSKGTHYFKIVDNGAWYGCGGIVVDRTANTHNGYKIFDDNAGDCTLKATGGEYTFTYDPKTKQLRITHASDNKMSEMYKVSLVGDFNGWNQTKSVMKPVSDTEVAVTIPLSQGSYNFKVVKDDLWYGNGISFTNTTSKTTFSMVGSDNTIIATGGDYTFTYNVVEDKLSVTAVLSNKEPADLHKVYLSGDFNNWSKADAPMKKTSSEVVSATVSLKAGQYDFKVIKDDLWYGNAKSFTNTTSGLTLTCTSGNSKIVTTGGDYTFSYNVVEDKLVVTAVLSNKDAADNYDVYLSGEFNSWSRTENPMTKESAEVVSTTVSLKAGQYDFKIIKDEFWFGNTKSFTDKTSGLALSYTSGNCTIVTSGGDYTFKFNVVTNKLTVTYVASTNDEAVGYTAALSGDFNSWSTTSDMLTYHSTNEIATTIHLDYGTYYFKIVDTLWYGSAEVINDTTSGYIQLDSTATECTLNATGGDYTFIYDVVTKKLKITAVISETDFAEDAVVSLAGEFNEWDVDANAMKYYDKNKVFVTLDIPAGSHLFKVVHDGLWYGSDIEIFNDTATNGVLEMSILAGECKIHAKGGKYIFVYDVRDHLLEVIHYEEEVDYTKDAVVSIAGDFNNWNEYTNPMTIASYTTMTADVYLTAGSYNFKIVHDGNWYGNSGAVITDSVENLPTSNTATDILLEATKAGTYTFIYNVVKNSLTINYSSEDTAQYSTVNISGEFNGWSKTDALTYSGSGVFTVTKTLDAGTYKFKMIEDGEWYGNNGTIDNTTTTSSDIGWAMANSAGDCTLEADGGSYTFKYNVNTNFLEVVYNG